MSITQREWELLSKLYAASKAMRIFTVKKSQSELSKEMGITRQALNIHLRRLKEEGLIRTGKGFIDLTEKALSVLGVEAANCFILVKVQPKLRNEVYSAMSRLPIEGGYRVTGDVDLVLIVNQSNLASVLRELSKLDGVIHTSSHIVIEELKPH
ncbi:MAG: Lrp/AsnC family transcriptional regulator [Candidatus Nezhaarchaeales archaeon]